MLIILQISNVSVLSLPLIVPYGAVRCSLREHFKSITLTAGVGVIFLFLVSLRPVGPILLSSRKTQKKNTQ